MSAVNGPRPLGWLQRGASVAGPLLLRALSATWRVRLVNDAPWRRLLADNLPFVFSLWHGELLPLVAVHRGDGIRVLISEHGDGEVIARIVQRFGLETVRGSSSRGAARALLALCESLRGGAAVAVTPDGPRGPAHSYAPGGLIAANRTGAPVIAIAVEPSSAWRLRSWDSFMIPRPFARVTVAYSDPEMVAAPDSRAAAEQTERFGELMARTAERARAGARPSRASTP